MVSQLVFFSIAVVAAVGMLLRWFGESHGHSKRLAMEAFGAEVLVEDSPEGTITPELIQRMKARAYALAERPGHFYADQFGSPDVRRGYEQMGREIVDDLGSVDKTTLAPP